MIETRLESPIEGKIGFALWTLIYENVSHPRWFHRNAIQLFVKPEIVLLLLDLRQPMSKHFWTDLQFEQHLIIEHDSSHNQYVLSKSSQEAVVAIH